MVANAFSAAVKRSGFSSEEKVYKDSSPRSHHLATLRLGDVDEVGSVNLR